MRWLWFAGVAMVLAVASACGGGDKAASSLSDTDLKGIVTMVSDGLPWQVTPETDSAESNEQASQAFADPSKWLASYEKWGRTGGHTATFTGQAVAARTQAESYKTTGGAKDALAALRDFMTSGEAVLTYSQMGYTGAKIDVVDATRIGDDSSAYRLMVSSNETRFDTLVIIFRRGAVLAQASVGAAPDATDFADVEAVANQMDGRIQNILNGQPLGSQGN